MTSQETQALQECIINTLGAERFIDELESYFSTHEWKAAIEWIATCWCFIEEQSDDIYDFYETC